MQRNTVGQETPAATRSKPPTARADESSGTGSFWAIHEDALLQALNTSSSGLAEVEASERLVTTGPNTLRPHRQSGDLGLLIHQFTNPIVLILVFATLVSIVASDIVDALIILAIILASGLLGFLQERSATHAVAALLAQVAVTVEVRRDGGIVTIPIEQVVPGDIVVINAGDVISGDGRVLGADALLVDEAALTGEAFPVEKTPSQLPVETSLSRRTNSVFMGSHVVSGSGTVVVAATGAATELGHISSELGRRTQPTGFERGITSFGYLLVRATTVLVVTIFIVNLLLQRPFIESLLFSLALAVGLTPQLLPAIVSVSLATGARRMAQEQVIVKRLDAIEDFGGMNVLCTDKTGTITEGTISLVSALDASGAPSDRVWQLAWLNAKLQTGYTNPLDAAILRSRSFDDDHFERLAELPYDFDRKRLSVLVRDGGESILITKGALAQVVAGCTWTESGHGFDVPDSDRAVIEEQFKRLSKEGFRVLGVATRSLRQATTCAMSDEQDLTFAGFLVFSDPPKAEAPEAIAELAELGISVRIITGDNRLVAAHAGSSVGLAAQDVLTGSELDALTDRELPQATIFAEITPVQKKRIVHALQSSGHVVGFLGDGINDSPALQAADVGISVNEAVDVAKQTAAIVLLDKHLAVIADGVRLGRQTFANTLKYINVTTSANFGNMLSMAAAAAFLPFLPMLPRQILLLNFLSDIPGTTIAGDRVDPEQVEQPQAWNIAAIRWFMLVFGTISSVFDIATFITLRLLFDAGPALFRSGWFIESVMTELAVMLVLRTRRPFYRSRPSPTLLLTSAVVALITLAIPFSPLAHALGLRSLPPSILLTLLVITALYVATTEAIKWIVYRRLPGS